MEPFEFVSKKAKLDEISHENDSTNFEGANPFLTDPVLTVLFSQMSISDLKNSRLVCSLWEIKSVERLEEISFTYAQKSIKSLEITTNFDIESFHKDVKNPRIFSSVKLEFSVYLDTFVKNPDLNILKNFKITHLNLKLNEVRIVGWGEIQNILTAISSTVKSLYILDHKYGYEYQNGGPFISKFPALQNFVFETASHQTCQTSQVFIDLVCKILKNAPCLKSLSIIGLPNESHFFWKIINLVDFSINDGIELTISGITVTSITNYSNNYFESGQFWSKKLKNLTITGILGHYSPLLYFVDKYGQYLEICRLEFYRGSFEVNLNGKFVLVLPHLPNLKSLTIDCYSQHEGDENNFLSYCAFFEPFNLAEKFPKLRELYVTNFDSFEKILLKGSAKLKFLGSVQISEEDVNTDLFYSKIMNLFPNLSQIKFLDDIKRQIQIPDRENTKLVKICIDSIEELQNFKFTRLQGIAIMKIIYSPTLLCSDVDVEFYQDKLKELQNALIPIKNKLPNLRTIQPTLWPKNHAKAYLTVSK